jgi:hypothetical protein
VGDDVSVAAGRDLDWEGGFNVRDLGALPTRAGRSDLLSAYGAMQGCGRGAGWPARVRIRGAAAPGRIASDRTAARVGIGFAGSPRRRAAAVARPT